MSVSCTIRKKKRSRFVNLIIGQPVHFEIKEKKTVCCKKSELKCLLGNHWLTDYVIDEYLKFLKDFAKEAIIVTNTFFFRKLITKDYNGVDNWEGIKRFLSKECSKLLIPFSDSFHWSLCLVDMENSLIVVYDSLGKRHFRFLGMLIKYLEPKLGLRFNIKFPKLIKQKNFDDCGVYLLKYAEYILLGKNPIDIQQKELDFYREEIYSTLKNNKVSLTN